MASSTSVEEGEEEVVVRWQEQFVWEYLRGAAKMAERGIGKVTL